VSTVDVGTIDDFPVNEFRVVCLEGREIGILRTEDDKVYAVRNFCPHRGAPVCDGTVGGTMIPSDPGQFVFVDDVRVVRCPWHLLEFSLDTGKAMFGTSRRRLRTYKVQVRAGAVLVELGGGGPVT
jgi:nitrite reductase (NADH) small subunit